MDNTTKVVIICMEQTTAKKVKGIEKNKDCEAGNFEGQHILIYLVLVLR